MSSQYKVRALFWDYRGGCYRLNNKKELEELLNDGWKISRVDAMQPMKSQSSTLSATNVYILEKQSEDTKKSSVLEIPPHDMGLCVGLLPHGMCLRVELDTNETYYLKSGWKERGGRDLRACLALYGWFRHRIRFTA